jgi:methyltransferase (TIGR00027 family)
MKPDAILRDISDTALGVAVERAREAERKRPLFRDPYAGKLAGERGRRIWRETRHRLVSSGVVVRTAVFDELILQAVNRDRAACVLNLGAGLDARPYRLDLPADLRWVEADLPGILDYKAKLLVGERPRCRLERLGVDLTDATARRSLLDQVAAGRPTLVVCEGVIVYLTHDDVAGLASDLADRSDFRWWAIDLVGALFIQWGNRIVGRHLSAVGASMQFAPEEGPDFFRPLGWEPLEVRSGWLEGRRLGREPWLMRAAWAVSSRRRRASYTKLGSFVVLRRGQVT